MIGGMIIYVVAFKFPHGVSENNPQMKSSLEWSRKYAPEYANQSEVYIFHNDQVLHSCLHEYLYQHKKKTIKLER